QPTWPDGYNKDPEVFVVNFDGTDLHQVTSSELSPNGTHTYAWAVAWKPNGGLLVFAKRVITDMNGQQVASTGLYSFNADVTGQSRLVAFEGYAANTLDVA